jgi:UDP-N-acetylmuramate dehydrogenase
MRFLASWRHWIEMTMIDGEKLKARLPKVRGRLDANYVLADLTWLRVGGPAEVLFTPADTQDLADFLKGTPADVPVTVIGVGSNLIVRDGGVPGVVIRLGRGFNQISLAGDGLIRAGAAALDMNVARFAHQHGIDLLTFLIGIPGTIGGALRMNGGAHGGETTDVLVEATAVDRKGNIITVPHADMKYTYRHCGAPEDLIFTDALLRGKPGDPDAIKAQMDAHVAHREKAQPIRSKTGGSTFKNPPGHKSWQLIDAAGLRGFAVGPAKMSEMHCNFLINEGGATAAQIEELGETVRRRVKEHSGVDLEWEVKRIGIPAEKAA